jgi:hypothetical protein
MSDLDEPATVIWFETGPGTELGQSNSAHFDTLPEAVSFVIRMSDDKRERAMIRTHRGFQEVEALDRQINQPRA